MYMVVFVTLIVALTGTYAQVLALQTARLYANQTTVASAMLHWHATAIAQARSAGIVLTAAQLTAGCSLLNAGVQRCTTAPVGGKIITVDGANTLAATCNGTVTTNCWTSLPQGYNKTTYRFYSVYYEPTVGRKYVVTYVPPPAITAANPAPSFLTLPGPGAAALVQIGATMSDLLQQIKNNNTSSVSYGTIEQSGVGPFILVTPTVSDGTGNFYNNYTLPTGAAATAGATMQNYSLAIISSL